MSGFIVYATIRGVGPIPCGRPYPRSGNHLEAFAYPSEKEAQEFADKMRQKFADCAYTVEAARMSETERKAAFKACPMASDFLATLLQDAQYRELDESCTEGREARDSGTIYDCPDSTFRAAVAECETFLAAIRASLAAVPDGALAGLDLACSYTLAQMGSDLYLERAGHGAGFGDRDTWSDDRDECRAIGEALSDLVESSSGLESYFGDDGQIYISGKESS